MPNWNELRVFLVLCGYIVLTVLQDEPLPGTLTGQHELKDVCSSLNSLRHLSLRPERSHYFPHSSIHSSFFYPSH